ncbi:MAG TPA: glycosyltransferase [Chitinophagaceae bacterium]|nr:glycosyltransferase [Chitinophagaceae bacterium]
MQETAIIIPCFNEINRLDSDYLLSFLKKHRKYTIYLIDDGSTDGTQNLLHKIKEQNPKQIEVVTFQRNSGKGEAVRRGMMEALKNKEFNYFAFLDADFSTPFSEIIRLEEVLKAKNKFAVFGSRLKTLNSQIERSLVRHYIGRFIATLISKTINLPMYDTQCGAKIFDRNIVEYIFKDVFISKWLFDVEIIMRLKNLWSDNILNHLLEEPILKWKHVDGSKISISYGLKIPFELYKIKQKYKQK